jgi:hypothetical protein
MGEAVAALARADADLIAAEEAVEATGEAELRALRDAVQDLRTLLDTYDQTAVGDEDFEAFIEFQEEMARFTQGLSDSLLERAAFEAIDDRMQQRRLTESDFAAAREELNQIAERYAPLERLEAAKDAYTTARETAMRRVSTLEEEIAECDRLLDLGAADLDAPVERLRDPIEAYDDAVSDAFQRFKRETAARDVLTLIETTRHYPLVGYRQPPDTLLAFVREREVGTEPIPTLLEYAGYSRSKLDHYVDDVDALKRAVATQQTYLERLDASPLQIGWPPAPADELYWGCEERIAVVGRFAQDVVASLREVRALSRHDDYARLRESALARAELTADEQRRLEAGDVAPERDELAADLATLREALDEHPPLAEREVVPA